MLNGVEVHGQRVVVTGGVGFIGSHVVDFLVDRGADVVAIDDLSAGTRENLAAAEAKGASLIVGDIRDPGFMERELDGIDVVVHMACGNLRLSLGEPMRAHEMNATGTLTTCLAAVKHNVKRFAYVSSSEAYGSAVRWPMDEDHPLLPTTVYGAGKAAGELYAQACMRTYDLPVVVIRPFNAYGPREHASGTSAEVIPKFTMRILAGLPPIIFGDGSQTRTFTWVEETAAGIVRAAMCDALVGDEINISSREQVSVKQICDLLLEVLGASGLEPQYDSRRPGDVDHHCAGTSKAKEVLGFEPAVLIRDGLERYAAWVRETHQLDRAEVDVVRNW